MSKIIVFLGLLFLFMGCTTTKVVLVEKRFEPVKSGTIKISWNAFGSEDEAHEKAEELMHSYCAPQSFTIVSESENKELVSLNTQMNFRQASSTLNYKNRPLIQFKCTPDRKSSSQGSDTISIGH